MTTSVTDLPSSALPAKIGVVEVTAVLFDLDDTLLVDDDVIEAALLRTAQRARSTGLDPVLLAAEVHRIARDLWNAAPTIEYCRRMGISSWEGLCADFVGDDHDSQALRAFAPGFRLRAWRSGLAELGLDADWLATELAQAYVAERHAEYPLYPDAIATLKALYGRVGLGLVTNGPADLQRDKIARTGLDQWFQVIVVSAEIGAGKPNPEVFHRALNSLGVPASKAVMVGDAPERDVVGARACGMRAVWVDRHCRPAPSLPPDRVIHHLSELLEWLDSGAPVEYSL